MQKISPFLWFDTQAEEAASYYVSIFKNSEILSVSRYGEGAPRPAGSAMSVSFVLDGLELQALNGGPEFAFTEAISLFVTAETQDEIDDLWQKLTSGGGEESQCGWLKVSGRDLHPRPRMGSSPIGTRRRPPSGRLHGVGVRTMSRRQGP